MAQRTAVCAHSEFTVFADFPVRAHRPQALHGAQQQLSWAARRVFVSWGRSSSAHSGVLPAGVQVHTEEVARCSQTRRQTGGASRLGGVKSLVCTSRLVSGEGGNQPRRNPRPSPKLGASPRAILEFHYLHF